MHIIFIRIAGTASFPFMEAILLFSFIALCLEAHLRRNASYNENNIQKRKEKKRKKYCLGNLIVTTKHGIHLLQA